MKVGLEMMGAFTLNMSMMPISGASAEVIETSMMPMQMMCVTIRNGRTKTNNDYTPSPHTIKDVQFNTTSRGDNYVQINYVYNHIEGKRVDFEGQFVSIFYNTKEELEKTLNELT
jgi:hypothetical protein